MGRGIRAHTLLTVTWPQSPLERKGWGTDGGTKAPASSSPDPWRVAVLGQQLW